MDRLSRRQFLRVSALTAATSVAAACVPATPPAIEPEEPSVAPPQVTTKYREAPILSELVARNELPPVDDRLPVDPFVMTPFSSIGQYGGTLRRAYRGLADPWTVINTTGRPGGVGLFQDAGGALYYAPSFWESYEVSEDASEYVIHMRKGAKWSDGEDCDTEDVAFRFNDVLMNETLTPYVSGKYKHKGELPTLTIVDQYTFSLSWPGPQPLLTEGGLESFCLPAHYLKQFHPDYTSMEEIEKVVEEYELETWDQLWGQGPIEFELLNPERPVLGPWRPSVPPPSERISWTRNPYCWMVDPEGHQLPYIDEVVHNFFDSFEVLDMMILNGDIDWQQGHPKTENYTLYRENEEKGDYEVVIWSAALTLTLYINHCVLDDELRALVNEPRFMRALSAAIDREEINDIVYSGLAEPRQASPVSGSPNFDPEAEKAYAVYDPESANQWLDELGLTERDGDGFRLRPDGKPISIGLEYAGWGLSPDALELITGYWADIGVQFVWQEVDRSLLGEHVGGNQFEAYTWTDDRQALPLSQQPPGWYLGAAWAHAYYMWISSDGAQGLEPPEGHPVYELWDLWIELQVEPDETRRHALFQQILEIHKDNVFRIGVVGEQSTVVIVSNRMGDNTPSGLIYDTGVSGADIGRPAQLYFSS